MCDDCGNSAKIVLQWQHQHLRLEGSSWSWCGHSELKFTLQTGRLNVPYVPSLNCMSIWDMHRRLTWEGYSGTTTFNNQYWIWWDVSGTGSAKQGLRQKPSKIPSPFGMDTQQHLQKNQGISCFQSYSM